MDWSHQILGLPIWAWLVLVLSIIVSILKIPSERYHQPVVVIWDSTCGFCRRSAAWINRLSWLKLIHLVPSEAVANYPREWSEGWHHGTGQRGLWCKSLVDGKHYLGYDACRRMAWVMPIMWPLLPVFYCPPIPVLGRLAYGWIAKNRHRLSCDTGQCGVSSLPDKASQPK